MFFPDFDKFINIFSSEGIPRRIMDTKDPFFAFPPTDIVYKEDQTARRVIITMAVAGFSANDITVELDTNADIKGSFNLLKLAGKIKDVPDDGGHVIISKIAHRPFKKTYQLDAAFEVEDVLIKNGILTVVLAEKKPEPKPVLTFDVREE